MASPVNRFVAVLADDLSGAAELAGAALRYGLSAEVATAVMADCSADVCCVDANSRAMTPEAAAATVTAMTCQLVAARPAWIYKKTDSLLRGHVRREIEAMLGVTCQPRCLLCPANPGRGRIIRDGRYWIHGKPLHATIHAQDPTHPRRTSVVAELLGGGRVVVQLPDAGSREDLRRLAAQVDDATLPAGGVEFFEALLARHGGTEAALSVGTVSRVPQLFVCGSPAAWSAGRARQAAGHGIATIRLGSFAVDEVCRRLERDGRALLAIGDGPGDPERLSEWLGEAVLQVLSRIPVEQLLLEGGATALAILRRLGWMRLRAMAEIAAGTVLLEDTAGRRPRLLIKPGSYDWPDAVWDR